MHCYDASNPLGTSVLDLLLNLFISSNTYGFAVLGADYSGALSMLLRYPHPQPHAPRTFVHDALYLEQNPTAERGSFIISKYSGRQPESSKRHSQSGLRPARKAYLWEDLNNGNENSPPAYSTARNSPKSLETLLQDVSQGIQRRTESWGVAKAVRGAVTEARKNMQTMNYEPGHRGPVTKPKPLAVKSSTPPRPTPTELGLESKINRLGERNKELAVSLGEALEDLQLQLAAVKDLDPCSNDAVKQALARVGSVQSCLEDSLIPVVTAPAAAPAEGQPARAAAPPSNTRNKPDHLAQKDLPNTPLCEVDASGPKAESGTSQPDSAATSRVVTTSQAETGREVPRATVRPSLTDAGFSWMLEDNRNVSSFVSSASAPPEQTRHPDLSRSSGSPLFGTGGDEPESDAEHDELALRSLRRDRGPL